jgi:hypothetical protein
VQRAEDESGKAPQARRRRGDISIADAVRAAHRLGIADPADLAAIYEILDLPIPATPVTLPPEPSSMPFPPSQGESFTTPSTEPTPPTHAGITGTPIAARLYQDDRTERAPAWLNAVHAILPADSGSFGVPPEPPLPAMQARSSIATLAATRRPGRSLDVAALVRRSARLQPPTASFLLELRTAPFVQLLVDRGEGMEPYASDLYFLVAQFMHVAGHDRVERRTFLGTPRRGVDPNALTGKTAKWKRPAPKSLVLVLTDLGIGGPPGSPDRARAGEWRAVAAMVASAQADLKVLTPFPPSRWPAGLAERMRIISWDSLAHLVRLRD